MYAVESDYRSYCEIPDTGIMPSNLAQLLTAASWAVREATMTCFYKVDDNGVPIDGALSAAFRDATCAQAQAMDALGIDPAMGGASQPNTAASKSISGASITYSSSEQQAAALLRQQVATGLAPAAVRILRAAGMPLNTPWRVG